MSHYEFAINSVGKHVGNQNANEHTWINNAMKQIKAMTMTDDEGYSCDTADVVCDVRETHPMKDLTNRFIHKTNGLRESNGIITHKISRLCHPEANHISYPPSLQQLDSTTLCVLTPVTNGTTDTNVDAICEQLNSIDMCVTNAESHGSVGTRTESQRHENTFEAKVVFGRDRDGDTLLHTALILLETALAFVFIDLSPLPSYLSMKNLMCQAPLHLATLTNLPDVVRRLIVAGAEVESRDKDGNTPLHLACRDGLVRIVHHLLEPVRYQETKKNKYEIPYQKIPQDLSIRNYEGLTVLHLAAIYNHLDVIEALVEKDININMKEGKAGSTVLHYACERGNINLVRLLLRYRQCNINARTYDGSTPFDLARDRGHDLICMALAAAGARHGNEEYSDSD